MNKAIKKVILVTVGILVSLFVILVYHIATARPVENATIQVSRIDFDQPFDSLGVIEIKQKLHSIAGVKSEIIVKRNVVVYFHDNRIADAQKIYDQLMSKGNYTAKRFIIPANLAKQQVCPVMKRDGISYKFTKFVQGIFNKS